MRSPDAFVDGFRDRVARTRQPGQEVVDQPGIVALIGRTAAAPDGRVLVTDDRAVPVLEERLDTLHARVVNVFAAAEACHDLVARTGEFRAERCTAMVSQDLTSVPVLPLPEGLSLEPVSAAPDGGDGVPLEHAAAAALRADPDMAPIAGLDGFVAYLRGVPRASFFAAVDARGDVRATAAAANFDRTAGVFFVNTDVAWRGRGVGTAMTAAALRAAAVAGAARACLDSSALALSIYQRLGFHVVSPTTLFVSRG